MIKLFKEAETSLFNLVTETTGSSIILFLASTGICLVKKKYKITVKL